jgi:hypothetical protein
VQLQGGQFFIGPKRTGFIKFDKKGEGGGNPVLNGLVHLRGETALGIEIDQQGLLVVGDDDVVDLGGLAPEKTRPRNPEGEKKGEKEDEPPAKEEIVYKKNLHLSIVANGGKIASPFPPPLSFAALGEYCSGLLEVIGLLGFIGFIGLLEFIGFTLNSEL